MKAIQTLLYCALAAGPLLVSCETVSDTPPVNDGYATGYRMPDPDILTDEDRKFLEEQEKEYQQALQQEKNENAK